MALISGCVCGDCPNGQCVGCARGGELCLPNDPDMITPRMLSEIGGGPRGTTRGPSKWMGGPIDKYENEFGFDGLLPQREKLRMDDPVNRPIGEGYKRRRRPRARDKKLRMSPVNRPNRISDTEVGRIMSQGAYIGTILGLIGSYMYLGLHKDGTSKRDLAVSGAITLLGLGIGSYWSGRVVDNKSKNK
tara:strand:+ start:167 stop:733 length:567 start_codon:yes stop_codon:yes gene_type:complete